MTVLLRPGPTAWPLRVTAMRPPEAGYSAMVPNTWYRQESDPAISDLHQIRNANTGWGPIWESGINIGTGRTVLVQRAMSDRSTPAFGATFKRTELVEAGSDVTHTTWEGSPEQAAHEAEQETPTGSGWEEPDELYTPSLWCCSDGGAEHFQVWDGCRWNCNAACCTAKDTAAAAEAAAAAGGGTVVNQSGATVAVVTVGAEGATVTTPEKHGHAATTAAAHKAPEKFQIQTGAGRAYKRRRASTGYWWAVAAGAVGVYYLWQRAR